MISGKRRGPPATGIGKPVVVRMNPSALAALDAWRRAQADLPTRPEAIRRLVDKALTTAPVKTPPTESKTAATPAARSKPMSKVEQIAALRKSRTK